MHAPPEPRESFYPWLSEQRDRADDVGRLARRFVVDGGRRWTFTSLLNNFFFGEAVVDDADFDALYAAEREYVASRKARAKQAPEATSDASAVRWYRNVFTRDALPRNVSLGVSP
jgi:hypothetical protein